MHLGLIYLLQEQFFLSHLTVQSALSHMSSVGILMCSVDSVHNPP